MKALVEELQALGAEYRKVLDAYRAELREALARAEQAKGDAAARGDPDAMMMAWEKQRLYRALLRETEEVQLVDP